MQCIRVHTLRAINLPGSGIELEKSLLRVDDVKTVGNASEHAQCAGFAGIVGALAVGNVDSEHDNAGDGSVALIERLIDEIEIAIFRDVSLFVDEAEAEFPPNKGLSGAEDLVEDTRIPLLGGLGQRVAQGLA